jgi:SPP1 family holin
MKPTKETIIRTILLIVAIINQVLTSAGKNPIPFSDEEIYGAITAVITVAMTAWAWWKNNSFTQAALEADVVMRDIKAEKKGEQIEPKG